MMYGQKNIKLCIYILK